MEQESFDLPSSKLKGKSSMAKILGTVGTAGEVLAAGTTAVMIGKCFENIGTFGNFLLRNGVSALGAGGVFALLSTGIRYAMKYQEELQEDPELTQREFLSKYGIEMGAYFTSVVFLGGTSFGMFTGAQEYFTSVHGLKLEPMVASAIAFATGMATIVGGNLVLTSASSDNFNIHLPWEKLPDIAGVFMGFIAGINLLDSLSLMGRAAAFVPTALGSAGALLGNLTYKALSYSCSYFSSAQRHEDVGGHLSPSIQIKGSEKNCLDVIVDRFTSRSEYHQI